jgi:hypothetical protein
MKRHEQLFSMRSTAFSLLLLTLITAGCNSVKQYATLAEGGANYADAVAGLADKASALQVESSSYQLLDERSTLSKRYKGKLLSDTLEVLLRKAEKSDAEAIRKNRMVKDVAMNLRDYFSSLHAMASTQAQSDTGKKTGEIITQLNLSIMVAGEGVPVGVSAIVSPVMTRMTEAALKKELTDRKATILSALKVIRKLDERLERTARSTAAELDITTRYARVTSPYADSHGHDLTQLAGTDLWIRERRNLMLGTSNKDEARAMIDAAGKSYRSFMETFNGMTSGKEGISMDDLTRMADELKAFNTFVKNL